MQLTNFDVYASQMQNMYANQLQWNAVNALASQQARCLECGLPGIHTHEMKQKEKWTMLKSLGIIPLAKGV